MNLNRVAWVARRELTEQFESPVAYVVVVLFLLITGAMFWLPFFGESSPLSLRSFFVQAPLFLSFFVPAMTMSAFSREDRAGTLHLMMTLPVTEGELVLGKFVSACGLLAAVLIATLAYPMTLAWLAPVGVDFDWGAVMAGYIGLMMLGASYAAIGVMASSWTRDQVVAILTGFTLCFGLHLLDQFAGDGAGSTSLRVVEHLSTSFHFRTISRGVIALSDVTYFGSLIGLSLMIARASVVARRL